MLDKLWLVLICCGWLIQAAHAQFGKTEPTPLSKDEYYAQRAMSEAGRLSEGVFGDIITDEDAIDLRRAQIRLDEARTIYTSLCADTDLPLDQRARTCHALADLYRRGLGISQNYELARQHYDWACLTGNHIPACMQQAYTAHTDHDGRTDYAYARKLYDHACQLSHPAGCAGLGNMMMTGLGGKKDRRQGLSLMQEACSSGDSWACQRLITYGCLNAGIGSMTPDCRLMTGRR